jgi:hypothetical protein
VLVLGESSDDFFSVGVIEADGLETLTQILFEAVLPLLARYGARVMFRRAFTVRR